MSQKVILIILTQFLLALGFILFYYQLRQNQTQENHENQEEEPSFFSPKFNLNLNNENVSDTGDSQIRILTFNLFYGGSKVENGIDKIAKHIKLVNPDIAALQEIQTQEQYDGIMKALGPEWVGTCPIIDFNNNAIVTRHSLDQNSVTFTKRGVALGANITLTTNNQTISFWSIHLYPRPYGPYFAPTAMNLGEIMVGEFQHSPSGRVLEIMEMLNSTNFKSALKQTNEIPLLVAGDFNTPSHLDWTEDTKDLHHNWAVSWPVTNIFQSITGLKDSFREVFPNPREHPGNTWTCVNETEPQDRIDFIFYKSPLLTPYNSYIYSGNEVVRQAPNLALNDYPSDHYAVITNFYYRFN